MQNEHNYQLTLRGIIKYWYGQMASNAEDVPFDDVIIEFKFQCG